MFFSLLSEKHAKNKIKFKPEREIYKKPFLKKSIQEIDGVKKIEHNEIIYGTKQQS